MLLASALIPLACFCRVLSPHSRTNILCLFEIGLGLVWEIVTFRDFDSIANRIELLL
jgi:hypothetical protein